MRTNLEKSNRPEKPSRCEKPTKWPRLKRALRAVGRALAYTPGAPVPRAAIARKPLTDVVDFSRSKAQDGPVDTNGLPVTKSSVAVSLLRSYVNELRRKGSSTMDKGVVLGAIANIDTKPVENQRLLKEVRSHSSDAEICKAARRENRCSGRGHSAEKPGITFKVPHKPSPDRMPRKLDLHPLTMGLYAFRDETPKRLSDAQKTALVDAIQNCDLEAPATGKLSKDLLRLIAINTRLPRRIRKAAREKLNTPPA